MLGVADGAHCCDSSRRSLADLIAGLVDRGADGRVVEALPGNADAVGVGVASTEATPARFSTSAVMAPRQWPQLTPGTE